MSSRDDTAAIEAAPATTSAGATRDAALGEWLHRVTSLHVRLRAAGLCIRPDGALARDGDGSPFDLPPVPLWRSVAGFDHTRLRLKPRSRLLCAGEAAPLLALALGDAGFETHAIVNDPAGAALGSEAARCLGLQRVTFHHMTPDRLDLPARHFNHAYSAGYLEHLDYPLKQQALAELARCLCVKGLLSITFHHGDATARIWGIGDDARLRNRLATKEDVVRSFLETGLFDVKSALELHDPVDVLSRLLPADRREGLAPANTAPHCMASLVLRALETPAAGAGRAPPQPLEDLDGRELPATLLLSVIICTYRRPGLLREALASVLEQNLPRNRFEVIVIDNNSRDATETVVRDLAAQAGNIRYVLETRQGLSHSRNRGAAEASGDYLVYLDDDARAHHEYLLNACRTILDFHPDILGGPIFPYYTTKKPAWFKDEYEIRRHAKQTGWSTRCSISGSSFIIRRALLGELGGFDPALGMVGDTVRLGEEKAVLKRYRLRPLPEQKVYYDLGCIVYHHVPAEKMTSGYLLKRHYVAGHAKAQIERLTRGPWGRLERLQYLAACCKGRLGGLIEEARQWRPRRRLKQFLVERASGLMFEVGRAIGCFSPRRKGNPIDGDAAEG